MKEVLFEWLFARRSPEQVLHRIKIFSVLRIGEEKKRKYERGERKKDTLRGGCKI